MAKTKKFSRAEIARQLNSEWNAMIKETGLIPDPDELKRLAKSKDARLELFVAEGVKITLGTILQNGGKTLASVAKIETEEQLQDFILYLKGHREELPTVMRKAMKLITAALPRRGGPGRQPKLNLRETSQICDRIASVMRQGHTLKQALDKVSQLTRQLLGKDVSPRTLQKAWNDRGKYPASNLN
jgi:hypothetical protein